MNFVVRHRDEVYERLTTENAVLLSKLTELQEVLAGAAVTKFHIPPFTRSQTVILATLARHSGEIVSSDKLLKALWGSSLVPTRPSRQSIRVHVSRIRKLGKPLGIEIEPVWGYGYRLTQEGAKAWETHKTQKGANDVQ